jgi:LAS superfamily LD-carboxypeptidase LdcB
MAPTSPIKTTSSKYQPPAALQAFGNGRIPLEMLTPIGIGGHRLYAPAAQAFMSMRAAAAAEGIDVGITDSYRTYEQQVDLAARKGLYSEGGYAAVPGTSKHGWGMAIDIDVDAAGQAWMRANAGRFGFVENVPREPWHWEFIAPTA